MSIDFNAIREAINRAAERPTETEHNEVTTPVCNDLQKRAETYREAKAQALQVYKQYQQNMKAADTLQTDIAKGIEAGIGIYDLFLQAVKALSLVTNNELFYTNTRDNIISIYGVGLNEKEPANMAINAAKMRLQRLLEADSKEHEQGDKKRIQAAIKAHRAYIERLNNIQQ